MDPVVRMPFYVQYFATARITHSTASSWHPVAVQLLKTHRSRFPTIDYYLLPILGHHLLHLESYPENANEDAVEGSEQNRQAANWF